MFQDATAVCSGPVTEVEELVYLEVPDSGSHISSSSSECHLTLLVGDSMYTQLYLYNLPLPLGVCQGASRRDSGFAGSSYSSAVIV